jgi:hypothetical protein
MPRSLRFLQLVASFSAPAPQKSKPTIHPPIALLRLPSEAGAFRQLTHTPKVRCINGFATQNIPKQIFVGFTAEKLPTNRFLLAAICNLIASD